MAAKGPAITPSAFYEIDVAPGLEQVALHELHQQLGRLLQHVEPVDAQANSGTIRFTCRTLDGREVAPILQLGTIFNAYRVLTFPVSRPKALLAHENFTRLVTSVHQLRQQLPAGYFRTFALNAAGADSPVFQQLTAQLARPGNSPSPPLKLICCCASGPRTKLDNGRC
ncbi:MAG: hypothetical protein R2867_23045 [Caldilineaceae bacterium]